jgi:hypothetical protein
MSGLGQKLPSIFLMGMTALIPTAVVKALKVVVAILMSRVRGEAVVNENGGLRRFLRLAPF